MLEEMVYFNEGEKVDDLVRNEEVLKKPSVGLLLKRADNQPCDIDEIIAKIVFGQGGKPPGEENCPFHKLLVRKEVEIVGVWAPWNAHAKAMALKWLFPNTSGPFRFPEEKQVPLHVAAAYDAFKYRDVADLMVEYPGEVLKMGFFTSDDPHGAQLIAKTVEKFENKTVPTTYDEKMVLQLSKANERAFGAFVELGMSRMSADAAAGEDECRRFFPPEYDIPDEVIAEIKRKPKRRLKLRAAANANVAEEVATPSELETAVGEAEAEGVAGEDEPECAVSQDGDDEDEEEDEAAMLDDKATSPMVFEEDCGHEQKEAEAPVEES